MKKLLILLFLLIIVSVCSICACTKQFVTLVYFATEGGSVYGNINQTVEIGQDCTQVYAVPEDGYRFIGWSDGVDTAQRIDTSVNESAKIIANFEKIEYVNIEYVAMEGGNVYGNINQTVEIGQDCTQVYAVPEDGYRFIGWSDGLDTAQRIDTSVNESATISAEFENIKVLFYSEDTLVRRYTLNEFKYLDTEKIVAYASFKDFIGWEFFGVYVGYNCDAPLNLIKTYFIHYRDLPDITLKAVFRDSIVTESVPFYSKTIAHALGGLDNKSYLNTKEAFESNYNIGFRFFEADISITKDGKAIIDHHTGDYFYEEFMNQSKEGGTPLDISNIFDYLVKYEDVWFDLDTLSIGDYDGVLIFVEAMKQEIQRCGSDVLNRIIIEITPWNQNLIDLLRNEIGINNFLYTEGWYTNDLEEFEQTCKFCSENGISFVSIPWDYMLNKGEEKVELLKNYDIYIFAYTTSNLEIMYRLYDIGVNCVFTDFTFI